MVKNADLSAGSWVEVRSKEEILATLDENGQLEKLPFMPEMFEFCGQRFKVFKRAHKTCDPPDLGARRMPHAVHLEGVRCNGAAHDGCQAKCLLFWKEAWLRPVASVAEGRAPAAVVPGHRRSRCTEDAVVAGTRRQDGASDRPDPCYACQATRIGVATKPLHPWDPRPYMEDYLSGNVRLSCMAAAFLTLVLRMIETAGIGLGAPVRWSYDAWQRRRGSTPYPWRRGRIPRGGRTPVAPLHLQPGEQVRIKSYDEIRDTIDEDARNRGITFDAEMVPYCGGTYRVLERVSRIINERTGRMNHLKSDCIILEDVVCRACYAKHRRFCPRSIFPYWREI